MQDHIQDPKSYGIYIVDRHHKGSEDSIKELSQVRLCLRRGLCAWGGLRAHVCLKTYLFEQYFDQW